MDRRTIVFVVLMTVTFFVVNHFLFPSKPATAATPTPIVQTNQPSPVAMKAATKAAIGEMRYVIQNDYQQIVVSNMNGAIAEINLPLQSKEQPASGVKQIRVDTILENEYPQADRFPAGPFQTTEGSFQEGRVGGYYPLLRRDVAPQYYAMATATDDPQSANTVFRMTRLEKNLIEMQGTTDNAKITKTYILPMDASAAPYSFDMTIIIEGNTQSLTLATGVPEVEMVSGSSTQSLKYRMTKNQKGVVEQLSLPKTATTVSAIQPDWIANSNGFFAVILDPLTEINSGFTAYQIPGSEVPTRLTTIDAEYNVYPADKYPGYAMRLPLKSQGGTYNFRVFAGPLAKAVLEKNDTVYHADYVAVQSFHGWFAFISEPFAKFLFFLMRIFYAVVHSWGIAIILLTIALRIMLYPLNAWSIKSTVKMQKLAPKLSQLQERYKKDPKKAQMEIMGMYKEHGVNPLGGCFPLLIQMPFLIGMFDLLKSTFELRGASFIPGWIPDLSAPDVVFSWHTPIWFFGTSFHLLPILLGLTMFWQQRMSVTAPKDPKTMSDQQKQQRFMGNIMTIVFTVLFYNFPSGLNIYWLSSMLLGILQQSWMTKRIKLNS
jgi:YidC/Oxa1 family membrane protein insertase